MNQTAAACLHATMGGFLTGSTGTPSPQDWQELGQEAVLAACHRGCSRLPDTRSCFRLGRTLPEHDSNTGCWVLQEAGGSSDTWASNRLSSMRAADRRAQREADELFASMASAQLFGSS